MKSFFENKFFLSIAIVLILINLILINLPLTKYFSFEFSIINSIFISFLFGLLSLHLFKLKKENETESSRQSKNIFYYSIIILIIPIVIAFINSLFSINCSFIDGLKYYIVITLPAVIIGVGIASISNFISNKLSYLIFILIWLLILIIPLFEFYFNPQIYFYNPIFAFYPGTIYDEEILVDIKLISYRIINVIYFLSFIIILESNKKVLFKIISFFGLIIIAFIFYFISPQLGFSTNENRIKKELGNEVITPNFRIIYSSKISNNELQYLILSSEYYFSELEKILKEKVPEKITIFLFDNSEQKKKLFGSENADVTKPWLRHIYIARDSYESNLNHELVHIFSGNFGKYPFKVADKINPAMIEGLATAIDNNYDDLPIDYLFYQAQKNNNKINLNNLFEGINFFGQVSSLSYIASGSFIRFLIEKYGIEKVKLLYSNLDFQKIFNNDFKYLENGFNYYINSLNYNVNNNIANFYFGRKPLILKVCPRYFSEQISQINKLIGEKKYKAALVKLNSLEKISMDYSIVSLKTYCLEKLNKKNNAINYLQKNILKFHATSYEYYLKLKLADLHFLNNDSLNAKKIYQELIDENPNYRISNTSMTRLKLMENKNLLENYLDGNNSDRLLILFKLNDKEIFTPSISIMIDLLDEYKINYETFINLINSDIIIKNNYDILALIYLSKYSLKNIDFITSEKFIDLIEKNAEANKILNNEPILKLSFEKQKDKLVWIKENIDEIIYKTKYN